VRGERWRLARGVLSRGARGGGAMAASSRPSAARTGEPGRVFPEGCERRTRATFRRLRQGHVALRGQCTVVGPGAIDGAWCARCARRRSIPARARRGAVARRRPAHRERGDAPLYERNRHLHLSQAGEPRAATEQITARTVKIAMTREARSMAIAAFWTRPAKQAGFSIHAERDRDSHGIRSDADVGCTAARGVRAGEPRGRTHRCGNRAASRSRRARGGKQGATTKERSDSIKSIGIYARVRNVGIEQPDPTARTPSTGRNLRSSRWCRT